MRRFARAAAVAAVAGLALLAIAALPVAGWLRAPVAEPPPFARVRSGYVPSEAVLLDRHGEPLDEIRVDDRARRLAWTPLDAISPAMTRAIVASEDRRFREHRGVDWPALASALAGNTFRGGRRGASTLSMQLASILAAPADRRKGRRTFAAKVAQIRAARRLEARWSKEQILEAYLNLVTYRGELQGIASASRFLFGKSPGGLSDAESMLLAALVRSPNAPAAAVARRSAALAGRLRLPLRVEALATLADAALASAPVATGAPSLAPAVARKLLHAGGERVTCSLDGALQRFASEALAQQLELLRARNVGDGAILVLDNRSGEVLAYVANGGTLSTAICVDGITARRQAGSTLKPFLYQLAIERRILTAASMLDDSPLDVPTPVGAYRPRNYDRAFRGAVSVRTALASSLNVPAVKTLESVGEDRFAARLRELGFASVQDAQDFGASLALGSADVTLLELTNAFRTLANGGIAGEVSFLPRKGTGLARRVASADAVYVVADILADRGARGEAFGLDNPLATPFAASAKTGTSKDMRDNWCVGFTDRYTVGVWIGNFDGKPMWNVSGVSGAAPAWFEVVTRLHRDRPPSPVKRPPGVTARRVSFPDEAEPSRDELFLAGTEPEEASTPRFAARPPRIIYPSEGMVVALDPDIPDGLQRLFFESRGAAEGCSWNLDGEAMGSAARPAPWSPSPGPHVLTLRDPQGRPAHAVRFSVRGRLPGR